jgi:hypothetical protein
LQLRAARGHLSSRKKELIVLPRSAVLAVAALFLSTLWIGCAASPPAAANLSQAVAPAQSERPDPNAPYVVPAPPRLVTAPASPATVTEAPLCSPDALKVQEIAGNVHGDYHSIKLGFRNQAGVACQLTGYPIVALFNGQGQSLGSIAVERTTAAEVSAELAEGPAERPGMPGTPKPALGQAASPGSPNKVSADAGSTSQEVVLMPKQVAAFQVVWSAGGNCPSVARLLVTAPGTTRTFTVAQPMSVCTGRIQLTPLALDQGDD